MTRILTPGLIFGLAFVLTGRGEEPAAHGSGHEHGPSVTVKTLGSENVAEKVDGKDATATTLEVTIEPGGGSPPHRHPGPVFGYVLEGEFETQLGDAPPGV